MRKRWFTILSVLVWVVPAGAQADRVVLLPPEGEASEERLGEVEDALARAVRAVGHEAVTEQRAWEATDAPPPQTANEMRAVAEIQDADWALVAEVQPADGGYWLTLRAGYAPAMRVEVVSAEVRASRRDERLEEILTALLRPEGMGAEAARVSGEDRVARENEARAREEALREPEEPRQKERDRQAERPREPEARERKGQKTEQGPEGGGESRQRYGEASPWLLQAGLGVRPIVEHDVGGQGGTLGAVELRVGRAFAAVPGLEARAGIDLGFGASTSFALHAGAVYLARFFTELPLFLGPSLEVGLFRTFTGNRRTSFLLRGAPVLAWRPGGSWFVEAAVPEVMWLSAGEGAITVGMSVRAGVRF